MQVKINKVTEENFAELGQVIDIPAGERPGEGDISFWSGVAGFEVEGRLEAGLGVARRRPKVIDELERHLLTPELLVPLTGDVIVPAAPADDADDFREDGLPDLNKIEGFLIERGQAVLFGTGVWHLAPFPLDERLRFLVVFKWGTPDDDLIFKNLPEEVELIY